MAIDVHSTPRIGYQPARRRLSQDPGGDDLDWLGLGRTLWRRKLFLVGFIGIVLGLTAAYVSRLPPSFEAEALVMLNDRPPQTLPDIPEVLAGSPPNEEGLAGQLLLIKSRSMAERMVDQLNLHMLPEFNPALQPRSADFTEWLDPARLIPTWLLDHLPRAWADTLMTTKSGVEMTDQQQAALLRSEIIQSVMDSITAEPANRSTVIGLKFVSTDPSLAALGANTLAGLYLSEQLETKQTASRRAREFLEHEIERLRASVATAEQAMQDYRRTSGLGGVTPDEQQLSGLTTQLVISRSDRAQAEARLRQVERLLTSNVDLSQAAQLLESPVLTELRARARSQSPAGGAVERVRRAPSTYGQPARRAGHADGAQAGRDPADRATPEGRGASPALARGDARVQHREPEEPAGRAITRRRSGSRRCDGTPMPIATCSRRTSTGPRRSARSRRRRSRMRGSSRARRCPTSRPIRGAS